ncbi:HAMP domain-containing sensor histidine kinase [Hymenobacter sp. UYP22]|uniref:HAMP domain-containing sensor histidine kinase n=1 Tax=Hymenobacter sp. UYP22 TaxID=3156348 RepID=UPI0033996479
MRRFRTSRWRGWVSWVLAGLLAVVGLACQPTPPPAPWLTARLLDPGAGRDADLRRLRAALAALAAPAPTELRFRQLRRFGIYQSYAATPDSGVAPLRAAAQLGETLSQQLPLEQASVLGRLAELHWRRQHYDSARLTFLHAAQVLATAFPDSAARATFRVLDGHRGAVGIYLAGHYANAGQAWRAEGRLPAALRCYDLARRAYQCPPDSAPQKLGGLAWVHTLLAETLHEQGELALVINHYEQALAVLRTQRRYNWEDAAQEWATTLQGYAPYLLSTRPAYLRDLATEPQPELRRRLGARPTDRDLLAHASALTVLEAQACLVTRDRATGPALALAAALLPRLRAAAGPEFRVELGYYELLARFTQLQAGWARADGVPAAGYAPRVHATHDSVPEPGRRDRLGMVLAREWMRQGDYLAAAALLHPLSRRQPRVLEPQALSQVLHLLAAAYARQGRYDSAYQVQGQAMALGDTLSGRQQRLAVADAEARYRTSLQELRIHELTRAGGQQRQVARWAGVGAAGLALALGGVALALRTTRRLAARLRAAQTTQNRLYSIIGHDLRAPLAAFEGLATLLDYYGRTGPPGPAEWTEVTAEVRQTTRQLTGLLNNLLHWAAQQSGELTYQPEPLAAAELLAEVAALYTPATRAREVTLQVSVSAGLLPLWADRNMVLTQLRNLLGNALQAAPSGSIITLAARPADHGLELSVADAGPGLTTAQLATLGTQDAATGLAPRLPGQRGTGLGLPLVRRLAECQQGRFWLTSIPGQGTTAHLALPLAEG